MKKVILLIVILLFLSTIAFANNEINIINTTNQSIQLSQFAVSLNNNISNGSYVAVALNYKTTKALHFKLSNIYFNSKHSIARSDFHSLPIGSHKTLTLSESLFPQNLTLPAFLAKIYIVISAGNNGYFGSFYEVFANVNNTVELSTFNPVHFPIPTIKLINSNNTYSGVPKALYDFNNDTFTFKIIVITPKVLLGYLTYSNNGKKFYAGSTNGLIVLNAV